SFVVSCRRRHTSFSRDWRSDVCSSDLDESSPLFGKVKGVMVREVERGSPAARAGGVGLRAGDIITSVNRQEVTSLEDFRKLASGEGGLLLLNIRRGNTALFIAVR